MSDNQIDFSERQTKVDVDPIFVERWSPRAFQQYQIDDATLLRIMEAARWSPSCFNAQPWRLYTSTPATFDAYLNLLVEGNQDWAKDTSVIGFMVAERHFEHNGKPNAYAQFDCGAAWMALTLQARKEGLYTHGMGGILKPEVTDYLKLDPAQQEVVMGFTIGKLADLSSLSDEKRSQEVPNSRKSLDEIWFK